MELNFINKGKEKEFIILIILLAIIAFIQFCVFKFTLAEMVVFFSSGLVLGRFYYGKFFKKDVGKKIVKIVFGIFVFSWIIAVFLDPLTKPWLDEHLNANTVGTFSNSLFTNTLLLISFILGFLVVWIINKEIYENFRSYGIRL